MIVGFAGPRRSRKARCKIIYQIRFRGQLGSQWSDWFDDLAVTWADGDTLLTGEVDQAALHGLLKKVRDLGMPLVSVIPLEPDDGLPSETKIDSRQTTGKEGEK